MTRCTTVWLVLALVACGDDGNDGRLVDAPPTVDGQLPAGAIVTVTLGGKPAKGQIVYFQSGSRTDTQTTGDDGNASAMIEAGSTVTVIEPEAPQVSDAVGPRIHLSTFTQVQPSDHLYVDVPVFGQGAVTATITVTIPNEQRGWDYYLQTSCGGGYIARGTAPPPPSLAATLSAQIPLTRACTGPQDVLVVSRDLQTNAVRSWGYQPDATLTDGATLTFASLEPATDLTFRYAHPVTAITGVDVTRQVRTARGELSTSAGFAGLSDGALYATTFPDIVSPAMTAITTSQAQATDGFGQHSIITWGPSQVAVDLDLTAVQLHPYTGIPAFDVAAQAITWTDGPAGAAPDFAVGAVRGARAGHDWTWRVVAPYVAGQTKLVFPKLPTTELDFAFVAGDQPVVDSLTTVKSSAGGYDGARARVFASDLSALATTATGQIVAEDMFFAPINSVRSVRKPVTMAR